MPITNNHNISLPMAVWLLHDEYDYVRDANYISATSLLKSTKQLVLARRIPAEARELDVADLIASRMGTAVHDSIEKAWTVSGKLGMVKLGYPEHIAERITINPTPEMLAENPSIIPVYMEQRVIKEITVLGKTVRIGGKYDMVIDGSLFDAKTTSVYSYLLGDKDEDYSKQGSIYRWLDSEKITSDHIFIQFLFTDWQKMMTKTNPKYPPLKLHEYPVELMPLADTERFIINKVTEVFSLMDAPEDKLPACTDKELWRSAPKYKYYADPNKTDGKSTKNFDDLSSANAFWKVEKAGKGIVKTVPGEVKACAYCPAYSICKQRDQYDV